MLHHWLASQEGFSINWQQLFRTYPNNKKIIFHNGTKLKSEFRSGENITKYFFEVDDCSQSKREYCD
jgi:hypothetical protein